MPHITLDVCWDGRESLDATLAELTRSTDVTHTVLAAVGPAGGWPVITFTGTHADLTRLVVRYCDLEGHAVDSLLNPLNPAIANAERDARDLLEWIKE